MAGAQNSDLGVNLEYAADATDALARIFALATPADVPGVWLEGRAGPQQRLTTLPTTARLAGRSVA